MTKTNISLAFYLLANNSTYVKVLNNILNVSMLPGSWNWSYKVEELSQNGFYAPQKLSELLVAFVIDY